MDNSTKSRTLKILLWAITILISLVSGFLIWKWIKPENIFSAFGFLILWLIITKVGHYIAEGLTTLMGRKEDE
jgi:polyferredoxin